MVSQPGSSEGCLEYSHPVRLSASHTKKFKELTGATPSGTVEQQPHYTIITQYECLHTTFPVAAPEMSYIRCAKGLKWCTFHIVIDLPIELETKDNTADKSPSSFYRKWLRYFISLPVIIVKSHRWPAGISNSSSSLLPSVMKLQ